MVGGLERGLDQRLNLVSAQAGLAARAFGVLQQPRHTGLAEARPPHQHSGPRRVQLPGDRMIGPALTGEQHKSGHAKGDFLRRLVRSDQVLQSLLLAGIDISALAGVNRARI